MSSNDKRPEAESLSAAAADLKDSVVDGATYMKDRVTAPASGQGDAGQDVKEKTEEKATEAKEHGKGMLGSISDGFKYAGDRLTASPSGSKGEEAKESAKDNAKDAKSEAKGFFEKTEDKAKEKYDKAGDKLQDTKEDAKAKYDESVTNKLATDPLEEAKAHGQIPADTATVNASRS